MACITPVGGSASGDLRVPYHTSFGSPTTGLIDGPLPSTIHTGLERFFPRTLMKILARNPAFL
jgi:hypothetical protein